MPELWDTSTLDQQKSLLSELIDRIDVTRDGQVVGVQPTERFRALIASALLVNVGEAGLEPATSRV